LDVLEFAEHDSWLELMMACRHACPDGGHEFVEWSTGDPTYADHANEIAGRWHSVDPFAEGGVTAATLVRRLIDAKNERPDELAPRRALAVIDFAGMEEDADEPQAEKKEAERFPLLTADDLLALDPPEWLLERAVPRGSLAVLYGPPKSAKTFLALEIALAVASGRGDVHGLACKSGRVLYVLAEGGAPMMRDRVWAWLDHHGLKTGDRFAVHARSVTLSEPQAVQRLLEGAGTEWDLVVFDTLARCMDGDENSVKDMNAAVRGCDRVRDATGAAVLLVHHSGKDESKGMRGSTALLGAVDSVMRMRRTPGGGYRFEVTELRHGEPGETRELRLVACGGSAVLAASSARSDFGPELASRVDDRTPRAEFKLLAADEIDRSAKTANDLITRHIPDSRQRAAAAQDGTRVWREKDPDGAGPNAEIMRRARPE
jgi:hypothetical protein